jgi:uncharacterized protein
VTDTSENKRGVRPFSLLVKPASADCNLRCEYCFYLDRSELYPAERRHRMSDEVLEALVSSYMATRQASYAFGWQGGEPTLMGVDFFRNVTALQQKYGRRGAVVANGLQTNATLIDDEFAEHLAKYRFLVGASLDGPAEIHNRFRRSGAGRGSHARVLEGIARLEKHNVEYNILILVSAANVEHPREVYGYLKERGFMFHQYIPCVEFAGEGALAPFAISGEDWGRFMCGIFDEWIGDDVRRVSVRLFDSILTYLVTGERNVCTMSGDCRKYFVVEYNGDVYPCDFFVEGGLRLGNVLEDSWEQMQKSEAYRAFGARKGGMDAACTECEFVEICMGDCVKNRLCGGSDPSRLSHLCEGWKMFYAHAMPRLREVADGIKAKRIR